MTAPAGECAMAGREPAGEHWMARPIFDPLRPALERLLRSPGRPDVCALNELKDMLGVQPLSGAGHPIRFVAARAHRGSYELHVFETGEVPTRAENWHDVFNALAWLVFPRTKSALNGLHAHAIPSESGRRGSLRDLLTLFDEGGAVVVANARSIARNIERRNWQELFWHSRETARRSMRIVVMGHAVFDMARAPWPGIACKVLCVHVDEAPLPSYPALADIADASASQWLLASAAEATPKSLPAVPIFGYPGWLPENSNAAFFDDSRYFRPTVPSRRAAGAG